MMEKSKNAIERRLQKKGWCGQVIWDIDSKTTLIAVEENIKNSWSVKVLRSDYFFPLLLILALVLTVLIL